MKFFNLPLEDALDEKWTRGKESIRVNGEGGLVTLRWKRPMKRS